MSSFPCPNRLRPVCSHPIPSPHLMPEEGSHSQCLCGKHSPSSPTFPSSWTSVLYDPRRTMQSRDSGGSTWDEKCAREASRTTTTFSHGRKAPKDPLSPGCPLSPFPLSLFSIPKVWCEPPAHHTCTRKGTMRNQIWLGLAAARVTAKAATPWPAFS